MSDSANQNKKPVWALTGLAIVAAGVIAFLTKGQWSPAEPVKVATEQQAPAASTGTGTTASEQPAPAATAEQPAPAAAAEQPAAASQQTAAAQPEAPAAQPAAEAPAASAEQPAAAAETPAAPAADVSGQQTAAAAPASQSEQPAAASADSQQAAAPAAEAPATEQPAAPAPAEAPAKTDAVIPSFDTVRVEKTGEAVIAGTAEAGADVIVKFDGTEIGKTTANEDGAFVIVPDNPLPSGSGELTIEAKGKGDIDPVASSQTVAVIVPAAETKQSALVAVVSPDQPTKILQKPEAAAETEVAAAQPADETSGSSTTVAKTPAPAAAKPVSVDAVDYDSAGNIVFSGDGTPGQTARIYVDNNFLADAPIGPDGHWSFSGTADVKTGVHQLRVDAIDAAGKVVNRVEVPVFREDQTKAASAAQQPADQTVAKTAEQGAAATASDGSAATGETAEPGQQTAAATAEAAAQPEQPKEGRVVIQPGNNLWRISRVLYGNGQKYTLLYQANKDQIRNPNRIYPGQVFKTPDVAPKMETIDPERREPLKPEENAATQN